MDELAINPWLALGLICACLLLSAFFSSAFNVSIIFFVLNSAFYNFINLLIS